MAFNFSISDRLVSPKIGVPSLNEKNVERPASRQQTSGVEFLENRCGFFSVLARLA